MEFIVYFVVCVSNLKFVTFVIQLRDLEVPVWDLLSLVSASIFNKGVELFVLSLSIGL